MSNLNPLTVLDQILADWASPRVRRTIHGLLALAASLVSIYLAAGGNWGEAAMSLAALLYAGSNHANTIDHPDNSDDYSTPLPGM